MNKTISNLIKINGPISVADFMNEALFNPSEGYYNKSNPFGRDGDFTTSPEISQVFGELIGAYFVDLWQRGYNNSEVTLVEMGAGRGTLMKDLLNIASKVPDFLDKVSINIVEISPKLRKKQELALSKFNINWYSNYSDFYKENQKKPIFFIANELFDCFAINQFVKTKQGWQERLVGLTKEGKLDFVLAEYSSPADKRISGFVKKEAKEGSFFEKAVLADNLMNEVALSIKNNKGTGIIIDYGYIENELKNTLQAVSGHKFTKVLKKVGSCDITALVNFAQLKQIASKNGLGTSLITQKEFLESLGIQIRKQNLIKQKTKKEQDDITSAINRLTDKSQMGELFKCLIFW